MINHVRKYMYKSYREYHLALRKQRGENIKRIKEDRYVLGQV